MSFTRFDRLSSRLLARFGGDVTLSRSVPGVPNPAAPWLPVTPTITTEIVRFIAQAAAVEWVNAGLIQAGDLTGVMAAPLVITDPQPGDTITAAGRTYTIMRAEPVDSDPGGVIHFAVQGRV
ncbi:hypothetical protein FALB51S_03345 [Frigidibacter albus]